MSDLQSPEDASDAPGTLCLVVINHEAQYAVWPAAKPCPAGWTPVGTTRTLAECHAHIREVWVDMRPRSLREQMDQSPPNEHAAA